MSGVRTAREDPDRPLAGTTDGPQARDGNTVGPVRARLDMLEEESSLDTKMRQRRRAGRLDASQQVIEIVAQLRWRVRERSCFPSSVFDGEPHSCLVGFESAMIVRSSLLNYFDVPVDQRRVQS